MARDAVGLLRDTYPIWDGQPWRFAGSLDQLVGLASCLKCRAGVRAAGPVLWDPTWHSRHRAFELALAAGIGLVFVPGRDSFHECNAQGGSNG